MQYLTKGLRSIGQVMATIVFNHNLIAAILVSPLLLMGSPRIMAAEIIPELIQSIDTSQFTPPSPDPAGIVYLPSQDAFLITDSEINEMPQLFLDGQDMSQIANVFKVNRSGQLLDTFSTLSFSDEPSGITINPANNHCFFSDDNEPRSIHEVFPGLDGICLTDDDESIVSFNTKNSFGSDDPEDVTYGLGSLFIVDAKGDKVYRTIPDINGLFNKLHSSFDTLSLDMFDPEGIVFDPTNDSLYIVGSRRGLIIHTTIYGVLLDTLNIFDVIIADKPAALALAPTSNDKTRTSLYMVTRGRDNDDVPTENDGMIYELGLPATTPENTKPIISAGIDQSIERPNIALLNGSVSDDEKPDGSLISIWSMLSGPAEVSFTDPNDPNTEVSFSMAGTYVLRLTGYDGELYSFDDLSVNVMDFSAMTLNVPGDYPTIQEAFYYAVAGDTLLLAPGTHELNESLAINKDNISIVSNFVTSENEIDIDTTIIKVSPLVRAIDGLLGQSANLTLKGLTIINGLKGVTFADDYGVVDHCKFIDIKEDAISFDTNAGGSVTHTRVVNAGDDAIDIDSRYKGNFIIAYNELINSKDDSIEIHLYDTVSDSNMHHDIHDNLFSGAGEDGIQLIDFSGNSKRTFDIYRNIFQGMPDVAIGSMFEATAEDFQGTAMTERVRIYNNYFYNNGYHITGGDNMVILNNIFESAAMTAIKRVKGNSIADYNLFYNNPVDAEDTLIGSNNLFESDPQKNSDFILQTGSPAIDAGTLSYTHLDQLVLQITSTEYTGQNPDIGRYEYGLSNTIPVLTLLGVNPMNLNLGESFTNPGATATDQEDGILTSSIKVSSDINTAVASTYTVIYTVTDSDGNSTSINRNVVVRDNTIAPVLTLIGANPINLNSGDTFIDPGAMATDDLDGNLTDAIQTASNVPADVTSTSRVTYTVTYTVTDSDGNTASINRNVVVSSEADSQKDDLTSSTTTNSGGGGTNGTLLLLLSLVFLFRHYRKEKWL